MPIEVHPPPLLRMAGLYKNYRQGRWWEKQFRVKALDGVDLSLERGQTLALLGKSGSGKTTLAMCAALLEPPDSGEISLYGRDVLAVDRNTRMLYRSQVQLIFQDSAALSPRYTAKQIIEEPLVIQRHHPPKERAELVCELMERVGLPPGWANRTPNQLSGGQRQRLAIARSLSVKPHLLILDEPFVGLDSSSRGQIINLLLNLQADYSVSYLYISHDWGIVGQLADFVAVMDKGRIVEQTAAADFVSRCHPLR